MKAMSSEPIDDARPEAREEGHGDGETDDGDQDRNLPGGQRGRRTQHRFADDVQEVLERVEVEKPLPVRRPLDPPVHDRREIESHLYQADYDLRHIPEPRAERPEE